MGRTVVLGLAVAMLTQGGCKSQYALRDSPMQQHFRSLPAPSPALVKTPVTIGIVTSDRRPEYSPGTLPGALFIPIIPYLFGDSPGVPVENCLTLPGKWGTDTEISADYVHVISYLIADTLRRSGLVAHAAYPENPAVLRQYELVLRLDFEEFGHTEGLITYGVPPVLGVPFVFWALGLPRGYVGSGGTFTWKLYEQASVTPLGSGRVEEYESTILGFYYGGGSYPTAIAGVNRPLLSRVVGQVYGELETILAGESASHWRDLIERHRQWRLSRARGAPSASPSTRTVAAER